MTQAAKNNPAPVPGSEAAHIAAGLDPKDLKYLEVNLNNDRGLVVQGRSVE